MADGIPDKSDQKFPPADVDGTLNPGSNKQVQVDPISSEVDASKKMKEEAEIEEKKKKKEKEDSIHAMKSAIIVSGIVVALAGAVLAIARKLREK